MLIQITNELNLNPTMCKACKGNCCSRQPGITHPSQWGNTPKKILKNLTDVLSVKPSRWAIDWWEGDTEPSYELDDVYFVRPAARGGHHMFHGAGRNAPCVFLADHGCTLKPHARPSQCLDLIPAMKNKQYHCTHVEGGSKEDYARAWRPYQKEILEAARLAGFNPEDRETDYVPSFWEF